MWLWGSRMALFCFGSGAHCRCQNNCFAYDLALVVGARNGDYTNDQCKQGLHEIDSWIRNHKLTLAPDKAEATVVRGERAKDHVCFGMGRVKIKPKK